MQQRAQRRRRAAQPPRSEPASSPHTVRPRFELARAAYVTVRAAPGVPSLRSRALYDTILQAHLGTGERRRGFRIVHIAVRDAQIDLLVEADTLGDLARGMQSFQVSIARRINTQLGRHGRFFPERYALAVLESPLQVDAVLSDVFGI